MAGALAESAPDHLVVRCRCPMPRPLPDPPRPPRAVDHVRTPPMPSILFGSISTLCDTSELQRAAFNAAFARHGLDWSWERDEYAELLQGNGGADRVADYASARGEEVDAAAVHGTKSQIFRDRLLADGATPRPGVVETIEAARSRGLKVALVTTTATANVDAVLAALSPQVGRDSFDLVVDTTDVDEAKPAPAAYRFAVETLGGEPGGCVAIEDNVGGVEAALAAGIPCVAFPNANTRSHDFGRATARTDALDLDQLTQVADRREETAR